MRELKLSLVGLVTIKTENYGADLATNTLNPKAAYITITSIN